MFSVRELFGKEVIGKDGTKIGTVEDVMVDTNTWQLTSVDVKLEGSVAQKFNIKKHFGSTQLPVGVNHIQGVSDRVVLRSAVDELLKLVAFSEKPLEEQQPPGPPKS
jgi:sporulation protein YlmC with PRC-barrel domain